MATFNFNVKVTTGKKTALKVDAYSTAVNTKIINFEHTQNTISTGAMAHRIEKAIEAELKNWKP